MKRSLLFILVIIVVITVALFVGKSYSRGGKGGSSVIASVLKPQDDGPANGTVAPDFTLKTLDGKDVSLSSLRGKAVMVNFWATWCEPCKLEMPWLEEFSKKYAAQGLVVLGVSTDDAGKNVVAATVKKLGVTYPILLKDDKIEDAYDIQVDPESFYVDKTGKVMLATAGIMDGQGGKDLIEANIKKLLAEGGQ